MTTSVSTLAFPKLSFSQRFNRHDPIPSTEDVLWRIEKGIVRTSTWSEDGMISILGYWGPTDVVGHALSRLEPYLIECLTDVETNILPFQNWNEALDAIILHVQQLEEFARLTHEHSVHQRLWWLLGWLADKFGCDTEQGRLLALPLTHQDLAQTIGTTRVSVTRALGQFEEERRLHRQGRQLVLRQQ